MLGPRGKKESRAGVYPLCIREVGIGLDREIPVIAVACYIFKFGNFCWLHEHRTSTLVRRFHSVIDRPAPNALNVRWKKKPRGPRPMGITSCDLYRRGNSTGPRMDNVRPRDVKTFLKNGVVWVEGRSGGVSTFASPSPPGTGKVLAVASAQFVFRRASFREQP